MLMQVLQASMQHVEGGLKMQSLPKLDTQLGPPSSASPRSQAIVMSDHSEGASAHP